MKLVQVQANSVQDGKNDIVSQLSEVSDLSNDNVKMIRPYQKTIMLLFDSNVVFLVNISDIMK